MKKILAPLLALTLMLTMIPASVFAAEAVTVKTEAELESALANGGDIVIGESFALSKTYQITKDTNIDFGGNTLTASVPNAKNAFSITANATLSNGKLVSNQRGIGAFEGTVNLNGLAIESTKRALGVYDASTVNVDNACVFESTAGAQDAGIIVWGEAKDNKKPTLNFYGKIYNDGQTFAISGNGADFSGTTINIYDGAEVVTTAAKAPAIYHPQPGDIMIDGYVKGGVGIEIRAGNLEVGPYANIVSSADKYESEPNGSGSTASGAAIAVSQHTTKLPINVTINGGHMAGPVALLTDGVQNNQAKDVNVVVNNGTFDGKVLAKDNGGDITVKAGIYTDLDKSVKVDANEVVTITDGVDTGKVVGVDLINSILADIAANNPESLKNFTVTIEKAAADSKFVIPQGVKVVNATDDKVVVNDKEVAAGEEVVIKAPTKPQNPQQKPGDGAVVTPDTSDDMNLLPFALLMIASLSVALLIGLKKKNN